ncbi:MBL fold metallo-hydrolase RNA specificity domain-containing protein [Segatella copri]|uniref:MBL fold metallo-hydrolase RNA specificity domain-containing protein n=1 Tax=Segatella copri TaxID=165179 RepID=UPI003F8B3800
MTEYEYQGRHLFVDYGEELPGGPQTGDLQVEGLTYGDISKSALLITHYHGGHIGCIPKLPKDLPIFMGRISRDIQMELSNRLQMVDVFHRNMSERLKTVHTFEPGRPFSWGSFHIMPVTVDHSAFDAYAFKVEAGGVSAFHTGDFRTHGFRSGRLSDVIEKFVGKVDYAVCEATNISRPLAASQSEHDLQKEYQELFKENTGNIVYSSSTNIDRLFGLYHAAKNAGRVFIIDEYQKKIMDIVTQRDSLWSKSRLYQFSEHYKPFVLSVLKGEFWMNDRFKDLLEKKGYVLMARSNPRFDSLIKRIPGVKQVYLSMWDGYVDKSKAAYNEQLAKSLGKGYLRMHTSGHCDMNSLRELFRLLHPKAIVPIHTEKPEDFAQLFGDEWSVVVLNDGESISSISSGTADAHDSKVVLKK